MFAGLGIMLLVAGAILTFAIDRQTEGVDLAAIGWILMAGGGLALIVGMIQGLGWMSMKNTKTQSERLVSDDGRHVVEETKTG